MSEVQAWLMATVEVQRWALFSWPLIFGGTVVFVGLRRPQEAREQIARYEKLNSLQTEHAGNLKMQRDSYKHAAEFWREKYAMLAADLQGVKAMDRSPDRAKRGESD